MYTVLRDSPEILAGIECLCSYYKYVGRGAEAINSLISRDLQQTFCLATPCFAHKPYALSLFMWRNSKSNTSQTYVCD